MYRIIIVDDEPYTVDSLYNSIQCKLSVELDVYKAYSAVEALDLLNNVRFDIVITDICMPGMDGLELMKIVKSNWPQCRVIFLTGYSEFDYVYTAIRYDGVKYLLKYEDFDVIFRAIEESVAELDSVLNAEELARKVKRQNETILPYLQQRFMSDLIHGRLELDDYHVRLFGELKIPLSIGCPVMLVMAHIGQMDAGSSELHDHETYGSIQIIAQEYLGSNFQIMQAVCEPSVILWFLQPMPDTAADGCQKEDEWEKAGTKLQGHIESIQNACVEKLAVSTSFLTDTKKCLLPGAKERYDALKRMFFGFIGCDAGMKIATMERICEIARTREAKDCAAYTPLITQAEIARLENLLELSKTGSAKAYLDSLLRVFKGNNRMHHAPSLEAYFRIAATIHSVIHRKGVAAKLSLSFPLHRLFSVEEHASWEAAAGFLSGLASAALELLDTAANGRMNGIMEKVRNYIDEHLAEDLSLVRLANIMYYNPTYLSSMFKQVTGVNLVSYINAARMEKAKEYLLNTNIKISDVAGKVGCASSSYFTQFFRREAGMSPHDFREKYLKDNIK